MVNVHQIEGDDPVETARRIALKLGNDKAKLEEELKEWLSILAKNNVGMNETLVDSEAYPRADIDVYQVRNARHRIICIRNDLKKMMKEIEEQLYIVHQESRSIPLAEKMETEPVYTPPIAKLANVSPNSPAEESGLKKGDSVVSFGSVCCDNFNSVADIANVVQHSINQLIKVIVLRDQSTFKLYLKPRKWEGQGVLGCVILPCENVER